MTDIPPAVKGFWAREIQDMQPMGNSVFVVLAADYERLERELDELRVWPHCEVCNFPLQDQGTPNGLVCLLCETKCDLAAVRAGLIALRKVAHHSEPCGRGATMTRDHLGCTCGLFDAVDEAQRLLAGREEK